MPRKITRPIIGSGQLDVNDQTHKHEQLVAANIWTITHNLNKFPSVIVKNSVNTQVIPGIDFASSTDSILVLTFTFNVSGTAYLN